MGKNGGCCPVRRAGPKPPRFAYKAGCSRLRTFELIQRGLGKGRIVPYWRLFYHLVWSTRGRVPLIDDGVTDLLQKATRATGDELKVPVHAFGTMPDQVHVAVSIPPSIAVATAVGRIKGSTSHLINHALPRDEPFAWESEYAALSFGARNLADVVAYIHDQPARHASYKLWFPLEPERERR